MSRRRMTTHQTAVAARVLAEESARRRHLVVHLSGAHAYGFPSDDSDLDLKCVHIAPTCDLVGLVQPRSTFNRLEVIDDVEIDYTSNELAIALTGALKGDGNMIERLTSADAIAADPVFASLQPLICATFSRRVFRHYNGFARAQAKLVAQAETPSAKKLLYVLRTACTGAHLLRTGCCQPDLTALHERYGLPEVPELIERKRSAERGTLDEAWASRVPGLLQRVFDQLDEALATSPLPDDPNGVADLEAWLLEVRRRSLLSEPAGPTQS